MTWPARFGWRVGAGVVLAVLVVVASGTDSAARVAPEWSVSAVPASGVSGPVVSASSAWAVSASAAPVVPRPPADSPAVPTPAVRTPAVPPPASEVPRGRWSWPLVPRPVVLTGFDAPEVRWGTGHRGVDLAAAVGQSVLAPADGVVTFRGVVVDRGVLVVETGGGLRTTFEPVESSLTAGTAVTQGQPVGTVAGSPGHCAPVTCLHWGVLRGDVYLDPLVLVGAVRVVLLPLRPP